jgi:hypothetical protein
MSSVIGVQYVVEGVAIAEPHANATIAAAAANIFTRFIIFSFSSLILNGDQMKASLVPLLHVLLKFDQYSAENVPINKNIVFTDICNFLWCLIPAMKVNYTTYMIIF